MASEFPAMRTPKDVSLPAQSKGPNPKHIFEGHEETVSNFIFLHDNVHIVSGSLDCTMQKWDGNTGLLVGEPWKGENQYIDALSLSPDGKAIACGMEDGSVQQWSSDGEIKGVWTGHSDWVRSLSWSSSGDHLASGSNDGIILIRQAESGDIGVGPIETKQDRVFTLAYSPSGNSVASGGDSTICIWDAKAGLLVVGPIEELGAYVTSVVWSSDNSKLYAASDKFARVFDSTSGALRHNFIILSTSIQLIPLHCHPKPMFWHA
ncbi:WD40-repeat-containing domain protein [Suillus americanus]|nr:WD40-repeat-containing domain protein [Suillus americanus]